MLYDVIRQEADIVPEDDSGEADEAAGFALSAGAANQSIPARLTRAPPRSARRPAISRFKCGWFRAARVAFAVAALPARAT
jgi:hypothetical protein